MATFDEILSGGGVTAVSGVDSVQGIETLIPKKLIPEVDGGSDSGFTFSPTTSATGTTMGFQDLGGMVLGGILSAINPVLGAAYSLVNPNSITRQVLGSIGFNPVTEGSVPNTDFTTNEDGFGAADFGGGTGPGEGGGFDSAAEDSDQSGGDAGSTSGTDSAGDGGDGYATGGRVNYLQGGLSSLLGNYYG